MLAVPVDLRVGTDIQSIEEVSASIREFGDRYLNRIFTRQEIESSGGSGSAGHAGLTARFAAKEAFFKVLRPVAAIPPWTEVEVVRQAAGWTDLTLHSSARAMAARAGLAHLALSLSHGGGFGLATVVGTFTPLEIGPTAPPEETESTWTP